MEWKGVRRPPIINNFYCFSNFLISGFWISEYFARIGDLAPRVFPFFPFGLLNGRIIHLFYLPFW